MTARHWESVSVGDVLTGEDYQVRRADLVRYAGAALDFNAIHWNERVASTVGLAGVIAHGMLTMAIGARFITSWCGDPAAVRDYSVVFVRPLVVPDDDIGVAVSVGGTVRSVDPRVRTATIALSALSSGQKILGRATAVVGLD